MASVVFSFTAVESFANQAISRAYASGFRYEQQTRGNSSPTSLELGTVERELALDEKLSRVLPLIFNVPTPKGTITWQSFKNLKKIRDRIVHPKTRDTEQSGPDADTLWKILLERPERFPSFQAYDIIGYFYERSAGEMPRWYANWPYDEPGTT